jgi:hypothetical protein
MRTRETSIDQIDGAADAFASRVRANQWAPQAERRRRPGGRQTGIVRGGDVEPVETIDTCLQVLRSQAARPTGRSRR